MSGTNLLLDTNIIIYALRGDETVRQLISGNKIFISIITKMELLSYHAIADQDDSYIRELLEYFTIISVDDKISDQAIAIRKQYRLKLPDSIICATTVVHNLILLTADQQLKQIQEMKVTIYQPK